MYAGIEWTEGGLLLTGAEPTPFELEVRYQREGEPPTAWRPQRAEAVSGGWRLSGDDLELELGARAEHGGLRIDWSLTPSRDIRLHQVLLARFDQRLPHLADLPRARAFRHGFQSWTPSTGVRGDHLEVRPLVKAFSLMTHHMDSRWWARKDGFTSYAFVVLQRGGDEALLLGFLGHRRGHGELFVRTRGGRELVASADYGGRRCAGGEVLPGEALWIGRGSPNPLMERYAELTAAEMGMAGGRCPGSPVDPSQSPLGWCSWYEYYAGVSEQDVLSNLEVLADQPHLGVAVVQLDDGFQTAVGDWLSFNDKFPRGLAPLAADIRARGFQAGVWTAPFFASARSRLFQEHPDWFLRHPRGKPVFAGYNPVWNTRLYSLDLTRPDVERWLGETFGALVEAGFDYFKIDFLFAGLRHGQHFDPGRSPVEAYRTGLRVIREAIGPERFLLGCGAPLGPSVGYVDAMRISQDVKESWDDWYARLFGR